MIHEDVVFVQGAHKGVIVELELGVLSSLEISSASQVTVAEGHTEQSVELENPLVGIVSYTRIIIIK